MLKELLDINKFYVYNNGHRYKYKMTGNQSLFCDLGLDYEKEGDTVQNNTI